MVKTRSKTSLKGRVGFIAGTGLATAFLLLLIAPSPADAQEWRGDGITGDRHRVGLGSHHFGLGLHRPGIRSRHIRVGSHRLRIRSRHFRHGSHRLRTRSHRFVHRGTAFGPRKPFFRHPSGLHRFGPRPFARHRLVIVLPLPLGKVVVAKHRGFRKAKVGVGPRDDGDRHGLRDRREAWLWEAGDGDPPTATRDPADPTPGSPPPPPPPPERCADVTVHMIAGTVSHLRIDVRSLGAETVSEAREVVRQQLRSGPQLNLRDIDGGGLSVPASLVHNASVITCELPEDPEAAEG